MRRPPSWPRRGWYRSHERRSRRVGRTARATRGRECRCTRRSCDSRHGGDCGGDEYDRPNSPRPPDPSRQEHGPFSRSTRAGAGQTYAGDASKVMGTGGVRDPSAPPSLRMERSGGPPGRDAACKARAVPRSLLAARGQIQGHSLFNECLERSVIDFLAIMNVDRTTGITFEAGVKQA